MNPYALIVLVALLAEHSLSMAASLLNIRAMTPDVPHEFKTVYDVERYARSQEYTRVRTRFGLIRGTLRLLLLLFFWQLGGFGWLDEVVRSVGVGPVPSGLLFVGALALGSTVLELPFRLYSTFVIEERFGFNRMTLKTFWGDRLKGLLLGVVLGGGLLSAIVFFFDRAGGAAWLWCWGAATAFVLAVQFVAPTWIMPLFNRFTPLPEGELRDAILSYARSVAFSLEGIFVIDGSRRSAKANAFFSGFGKHKRIALYDTLIEKQTTDELVAVVAHEVGHYKRKHIRERIVLSVAHSGALFWLLSIFLERRALFEAFYVQESSVYAGLIFFSLLFTPLDMVLSVIVHARSRKNEFDADAFAVETTGTSQPLTTALKKLSVENLANLTPHPLEVVLHHSHPPLLQRIGALRVLPVKG